MASEIRYFWGEDHLVISLGKRTDYRVGMVCVLEFFVLTGIALSFILQSKKVPTDTSFLAMLTCAGLVNILAFIRLLSRIHFDESIRLDKHSVTLIRRSAVSSFSRSLAWDSILGLRFQKKGRTTKTDVNQNQDILTTEARMQIEGTDQHGRLYLETVAGKFYFGCGLSPADAGDVASMIKIYTGISLPAGPEWAGITVHQPAADL